MRCLNMGEAQGVDRLVELRLSISQAKTVFVLAHAGHPMPINEIAEHIRLSVAAAGRNIDKLVRLGLVERREDESDRRVKLVSITKAGLDAADQQFEAKRSAIKGAGVSPQCRRRRTTSRCFATHSRGRRPATDLIGDSRMSTPAPPIEYPRRHRRGQSSRLLVSSSLGSSCRFSTSRLSTSHSRHSKRSFDVDKHAPTVAWAVTAYTLALATVIPLTGWAADRFGTQRLFITATRAVHSGIRALCDGYRTSTCWSASGSCRVSVVAC